LISKTDNIALERWFFDNHEEITSIRGFLCHRPRHRCPHPGLSDQLGWTYSVTVAVPLLSIWLSGVKGIFGQPKTDSQIEIKATAGAIIAFVLLILGIVLALLASLTSDAQESRKPCWFPWLNWLRSSHCCWHLILLRSSDVHAAPRALNVSGSIVGSYLGGGWVVAGILAIVGGAVALLPSLFAFLAKKK
jgi:hypothetical protein